METSLTCPVAQLFPIQDPILAELAVASDVDTAEEAPPQGQCHSDTLLTAVDAGQNT